MQKLKKEIRIRITDAALAVFDQYGYQKASMFKIANKAGVAIGNIYRYFKNKEELFKVIIEPAYIQMKSLVFNQYDIEKSPDRSRFITFDIVTAIMEIYKKYHKELIIMMEKSQGSCFENSKNELVEFIFQRTKTYYKTYVMKDEGVEDSFIYVTADMLVYGIFNILKKSDDVKENKVLIERLILLFFT